MGLFKKYHSIIRDGRLVDFNKKDIKKGVYVFPEEVKSIGSAVSFSSYEIREVIFPPEIEYLPSGIVVGSKNLVSVKLPSKLKAIEDYFFANCASLKEVEFPKELKRIGSCAFVDCASLERAILPDSLTELGKGAFTDCKSLRAVALPESISTLKSRCFAGCESLTRVVIPKSVENMEAECFAGCEKLTDVEFEGLMPFCPAGFDGCKNLTTVTYRGVEKSFPKGELCKEFRLNAVGSFIDFCVDNGKPLPKYNAVLLNTNKAEIANYYQNEEAFNSFLESYENKWAEQLRLGTVSGWEVEKALYKSAVSLGLFSPIAKERAMAQRFLSEKISAINPRNLVDEFQWYNTMGLGYNKEFAQAYMKNYKVTTYLSGKEDRAFMAMDIARNNVVYNNWVEYKAQIMGEKVNQTSSKAQPKTQEGSRTPRQGEEKPKTVKEEKPWIAEEKDIKEGVLDIPSSVKYVGAEALKNNTSLKEIKVSPSVESIGADAFKNCKKLESVHFEGRMPISAEGAFQNCDNLTKVTYKGKTIEFPKGELLQESAMGAVGAFVDYAVEAGKKLPKVTSILANTKAGEAEDFYRNANTFQQMAGLYINVNKKNIEVAAVTDQQIVSAFHKACVALGVFSKDVFEQGRAGNFVATRVVEMTPEELVQEFGDLPTGKFGYNKDFASAYIQNFEVKTLPNGKKAYGFKAIGEKSSEHIYSNWYQTQGKYSAKLANEN